jgi:hypothetical protein
VFLFFHFGQLQKQYSIVVLHFYPELHRITTALPQIVRCLPGAAFFFLTKIYFSQDLKPLLQPFPSVKMLYPEQRAHFRNISYVPVQQHLTICRIPSSSRLPRGNSPFVYFCRLGWTHRRREAGTRIFRTRMSQVRTVPSRPLAVLLENGFMILESLKIASKLKRIRCDTSYL